VNVLAVDGALGGFSAAVAVRGGIATTRRQDGSVALESGLALIADVLAQAGLNSTQLDRVAVGIGPGGFTGLRIAVSYAKSLALAWARPLVGISSFDLLEYGRDLQRVLTIVVGRPGVISARYRDGSEVRRASGRTREVLEAILPRDHAPLAVVGASEDALAALGERGIVVQPLDALLLPAAAAALAAASREPARSLHAVRADYGELPAAKVPKL
jgi:tRNA threonylcarbamoyladenosine biosynthesis protein TsaB